MLAIIGGTGLYQLEAVQVIEELNISTPYGAHSGPITRAEYQGRKLLFLPRHGATHSLMPHEVNYRANIWALKRLGALQVIGVSAVGSLQAEIKPGDFSVPSGYFDFVKGPREKSFFGEGLAAHVSTAKTTCPALTRAIAEQAEKLVAEKLTQLVKKTPDLKDKFGANAIQGQALNKSESAADS